MDDARVKVLAGKGGDGCVSFLREKSRPFGGPDGGDGGRGGSVIVEADAQLTDLAHLRSLYRGAPGRNGMGACRTGENGADALIRVPVGTSVLCEYLALVSKPETQARVVTGGRMSWATVGADATDGADVTAASEAERVEHAALSAGESTDGGAESAAAQQTADSTDDEGGGGVMRTERLALNAHGERAVVAAGGPGGLGNQHFATPARRRPITRTRGGTGDEAVLRLTLRLVADVGLVGFPNVGKSTLLRLISRATPAVGDYAFTTLHPSIGVVSVASGGGGGSPTRFTIADLPGLVEGAHANRGLGLEFLRHIERCSVLCFVVDLAPPPRALLFSPDAPDPNSLTDEAALSAALASTPWAELGVLQAELDAYAPGLGTGARAACVLANKADGPFAERLLAILRSKTRLPVLAVSALTGRHARGVVLALHDMLQTTRAEATAAASASAPAPGAK